MLTKYTARKLARLYNMCESNYHGYLQEHREVLFNMATKKNYNGKVVVKQGYNSQQLKFVIENIFKGDLPEGYDFNGENLIKREYL